MKNNRGFLLGEETVKIILAVIAISFLVYFLVTLYYSNGVDQDLRLAEATLENIDTQVSLSSEQVDIYNPSGWWYLVSWSSESSSGDSDFPEKCSSQGWENCLCICEKGPFGRDARLCENNGACVNNDFTVNEMGQNWMQIKETPLTLNVNYEDKILTRSR